VLSPNSLFFLKTASSPAKKSSQRSSSVIQAWISTTTTPCIYSQFAGGFVESQVMDQKLKDKGYLVQPQGSRILEIKEINENFQLLSCVAL
jgi:hypothetical protein